jgi:ribosomal-protein-alanine N-acetyltransferase
MIVTDRLELVPATTELTKAALDGQRALAAALGAHVPATWPPEFLDPPALKYTLARLGEGPDQAGWWLHFVVLARGDSGRLLIGSAGYKGPPSADGTVEIGYGIVRDQHRRGYGSEAVRGLLGRAFADPGVLGKCGFQLIGEGSEPGVIRFELTRAEYVPGEGAV